ncbi:HD domain-containing protein [Zavarzinia compransoris]|uniref:HD domain-containing protein n=1 Tax=Zavarzinia marina TaxID=2911065 RepID=UPI001F27F7E4|nr:HD domain-containing protein [Zavarzinia marina]MCF4164471.1 HD domain-containing protein [Zavarzinia marina]
MSGDHPTLEETAAFAGMLHAAQTDKAGLPYIGHLARVSRHLARLFPNATLAERHAAWLHDSLEDTPTTAEDLAARGYDPAVIAIVAALTKPADVPSYQAWIERLAASGFVSAMRVKLADLSDNGDPARLAKLPPEKASSLSRRYGRAMATLSAALDTHGDGDDEEPRAVELVPVTLSITQADHLAFVFAAAEAGRTVEDFIVEEALYLADMIVAAGRDNVRLARDGRARAAPFHEALRRGLEEPED